MLCVCVAKVIEDLVMALQTLVESAPVLLAAWEPACLGKCYHTWQQLVLELGVVVEGLGPQVHLCTHAILLASGK